MDSDERSRQWVTRLPEVISALNNEVTRLTNKKPIDAIKTKMVKSKASTVSVFQKDLMKNVLQT